MTEDELKVLRDAYKAVTEKEKDTVTKILVLSALAVSIPNLIDEIIELKNQIKYLGGASNNYPGWSGQGVYTPRRNRMKSNSNLKMCPLCKSSDVSIVSFGFMKVCAACNTCECSTGYMRDEQEAEEAWNERPIEYELSCELNEIRMMVQHYSGNAALLVERIAEHFQLK